IEPPAVQRDVEMAFRQTFVGIESRLPAPAIPHDHRAAAVLAFWNVALEIEVLHRMVFGADSQPFFAGDQARPFGHGPALERAAELEPQIVMNAPRVVLLDHELPTFAAADLRL